MRSVRFDLEAGNPLEMPWVADDDGMAVRQADRRNQNVHVADWRSCRLQMCCYAPEQFRCSLVELEERQRLEQRLNGSLLLCRVR